MCQTPVKKLATSIAEPLTFREIIHMYLKLERGNYGKNSLFGMRLNLDCLFLRTVKAAAKEGGWGTIRVWCMFSITLVL